MSRDINATILIRAVLENEGGVADVGDGKGVTRYGQTAGWLSQYGLELPSSAADAASNYRQWLNKTRLIVLCDAADALALGVIDWAVHAGEKPAIKALQRSLSLTPDGVIGPKTEDAIAHADRRLLALKVVAARVRFNGRLITDAPQKHARYAAGWSNRLAAQIEALV